MTLLLIAANVAIFLKVYSLPPWAIEKVFTYYGLIPKVFTHRPLGSEVFAYTSMVTSMFLHGGWLHLIGNMWALWLFGDNVEDRMGKLNFFLFYLVCGIAAALTHVYMNPSSDIPTVGASGAIAGVMGAYFILYPRAQVVTLVPVLFFFWLIDIPAFVYLGFWLLLQLEGGALSLVSDVGQIAFWAHVGGFVAGMVLHRLFMIKK